MLPYYRWDYRSKLLANRFCKIFVNLVFVYVFINSYTCSMGMKQELNLIEKLQRSFWRLLYPLFPKLQKPFARFHSSTRQQYHLGWLAPGKSLKELERHLHDAWGFGNHFIAWEDSGQVLSWRKLVDFEHQYHIRVFTDGEIRGHYEYTPEGKPLSHFEEVDEEERLEQFKKFLGNFLVSKRHEMHLTRDMQYSPESEITIDNS